jgi:hypothetical protein
VHGVGAYALKGKKKVACLSREKYPTQVLKKFRYLEPNDSRADRESFLISPEGEHPAILVGECSQV